jgi:hypothetical protein
MNVVKCVRGDLMTLGNHASDYVGPFPDGVNLTLPVVVATQEKGRFGTVSCEKIEKITSVFVGPIIEGHGNRTFLKAMPDGSVIRHVTKQWPLIKQSI